MATDVDRQVARSAEILDRSRERYQNLSSRARRRRNAAIMKKLRWMMAGAFAVVAGAMVAGWFVPLGTSGVMIVLALLVAVILLVGLLPTERSVKADALAGTDLKALPLQTEIWLEGQRKALPAPAVQLLDSIGTRLETLAPQLEKLNPQEPAAMEVRKLLSDHLPELVSGYRSIPEPLRREERNGRVPEQQLIEGLGVIDSEISQMTEQLASGDLDKLATHNRFLELKYQEAKELGQ
jgi:hypothetical protein